MVSGVMGKVAGIVVSTVALLAVVVHGSAVAQPHEGQAAVGRAGSTAAGTTAVWQRHIGAWGRQDLDAIMSDYTEDAVLVLNNQVYEGRAAIRPVFERLFDIFGQGDNRIDEPVIRAGLVHITWHFTPHGSPAPVFGTDTFVVKGDAIAVQTIASPLYERYPVRAAA
ncbi:nuclear transport factor 2 family protein [Streptomyces solincola]|nr:nuclear transport factor 2 family protein [Streptomyces solincola]